MKEFMPYYKIEKPAIEIKPYPRELNLTWLKSIGFEKDDLKKISDLFKDDKLQYSEKNIVALQQKGLNIRFVAENLFSPQHYSSFVSETFLEWRKFRKADDNEFRKFKNTPLVMEAQKEYGINFSRAWEQFAGSDYKKWSDLQGEIKDGITDFDNKTINERNENKEKSGILRLNAQKVTADSFMEIINGAPIASIHHLEDFGFSALERDFVWLNLGESFACTRFNIRKAMSKGFSPRRLANTLNLKSIESVNSLREKIACSSDNMGDEVIQNTVDVFIDAAGGLNLEK